MRWFLLLILSASAVWAQPLVNIETVTVGDAGNAADPRILSDGKSGYGGVGYEYKIGKYEVTIGQYTAFLNSVARTNTNSYIVSLWNAQMASNLNIRGISRSGAGTLASPYSYSVIGSSNRPITYVSWFDAARFANWLHNGATNGASTETGAYTLNGATNGIVTKDAGAAWWIPSENEWFKAAYYKGGSTNAGYWVYPTQSDTAPGNTIGGATNQANYYVGSYPNGPNGAFATGGLDYTNTKNYLTDAGAFFGSQGAYGTYDQGGNVREWAETVVYTNRVWMLGGCWNSGWGGDVSALRSDDMRGYGGPTSEDFFTGFRVAAFGASVPRLTVEQPAGTTLPSNTAPIALPATLLEDTSEARVFTVRNSGNAVLSNIVVSRFGADNSHFLLSAPATNSISPGATTTFLVSFSPSASGSRSAQLSITSNDTNNSPFVINLSGFGLGEDLDTDGDGLNDAAEFTMSALGFDWQSNQPTLVTALYSNANRAQLFNQLQYDGNRTNGQTDVATNPAAFNLFTQSQFDGNRTAGRQDVVASPMSYGLYDSTSIMDLRMGGLMLQKQGTDATIVFQPQTTTDLATLPFTNNGTPITNAIPMPGDKGFLRVEAIYVPANDLIDPPPSGN